MKLFCYGLGGILLTVGVMASDARAGVTALALFATPHVPYGRDKNS